VTDEQRAHTSPQDIGPPDSVERDPASVSSAEDLDEDRLRVDPLEEGMDPAEGWTGSDKYGMTPYEQAHPRPLDDRLAEEQPDFGSEPQLSESVAREDESVIEQETVPELARDLDREVLSDAARRGQSADEAGGSVANSARTPEPEDLDEADDTFDEEQIDPRR